MLRKESLNSDGQEQQKQQNKQSPLTSSNYTCKCKQNY